MASVKVGFGKCKYCGKQIKLNYNITNKYKKERKYCNSKCMGEANTKLKTYKGKYLSSSLINCEICGKEFRKYNSEIKRNKHHFCSRSCWKKLQGEKHHNYKTGYTISKDGIIIHLSPNKYIYKHRFIMEKHLGRKLLPTEVIHHLDSNNKNNNIDNLHLFPNQSEHRSYHGFLRKCIKEELKCL